MTFDARHIRNIGIMAHVDAGKTTITEQILFQSGRIRRAGSVDSRDTQMDYMSIERERGISVMAAQTSFIHKDVLVNLIDTPGHADFAGEVERALAAVDGAVLIISAVEGIQSHTENLIHVINKMKLPYMVFINKLDRAGSDVGGVLSELKSRYGGGFVMLSDFAGEGDRGCSASIAPDAEARMLEAAADFDDGLAERWLYGEKVDGDTVRGAFKRAVGRCELVPVLCGCGRQGIGISELMNAMTDWLPGADSREEPELSGIIFRIEHDKAMGRIAHVRLFGGELKNRDTVQLVRGAESGESGPADKITQIRKFSGARSTDEGSVKAGDIAALCGLTKAKVYDVIGKGRGIGELGLANPFLRVKVSPEKPEELTALVGALTELAEEDPLIHCRWEKTEREIDLNITGKIQLEVLSALLRERYNLGAGFSAPSVIYKETPARAGEGFERYTKPKPCWAVVRLRFEPLERGSGVVYDGGHVPNDKLYYRYQTHIRTSALSSLEQGNYGWEVTDLKITLVDGGHHTIHTHPLDFFVATPMCVADGLKNTGTTLLEPFLSCRISAGEEYMSRIVSDITLMRGEFDSPVIKGGTVTVEAMLPAATSMDYNVRLASETKGTGTFFSSFAGYRECPIELGAAAKRRGIDPLDRDRWILHSRGAL
ncbi:MAG: GTP-binding protein [Oscillospiraceae bacterium]